MFFDLITVINNITNFGRPSYHLVKLLNDFFEDSNPSRISSLPYCWVSSLIHLNSNPREKKKFFFKYRAIELKKIYSPGHEVEHTSKNVFQPT